jgi:hypothetical protein
MKTLCINIDSDTESWRITQEECARVGLNPERVSAVVEDNRPMAFNKSVYKAMERCYHQSYVVGEDRAHSGGEQSGLYDALLLTEDDVTFDGWLPITFHGAYGFGYGAIPGLPNDFMTLHLGANIIGVTGTNWQMPTYHNRYLAKLHNCWQSHATLYSAECVKFILDNFNPNIMDAEHPIFDEWLRLNVLNQGRSYLMNPMIAYQRPRFSEIWGVPADYQGAHTQGNEWLKRNL